MNDGMGEEDRGCGMSNEDERRGGFVQNNTSYSVCVKSFL
jgi:hypothetical protein